VTDADGEVVWSRTPDAERITKYANYGDALRAAAHDRRHDDPQIGAKVYSVTNDIWFGLHFRIRVGHHAMPDVISVR
jgi:hypothetical protein